MILRLALLTVLTGLMVLGPDHALAARQAGEGVPSRGFEVAPTDPQILRAQELLKGAGLYTGRLDGLMGPDTERAVRSYQRSRGLRPDGKITDGLLESLETLDRVEDLLGRLDEVRKRDKDAARSALLSNPATRNLVSPEGGTSEVADPTRSAEECLATPSPECLLDEAAASSLAIFEDDLRDWALGELLAAQAKVGLTREAMETARRIKDVRLIVKALGTIAEVQAMEGRLDEARAALSLIPDGTKRLEALLEIARTQKLTSQYDPLIMTIRQIEQEAAKLDDRFSAMGLKLSGWELLLGSPMEGAALEGIETLYEKSKSIARVEQRNSIKRRIATAFAEAGRTTRALEILARLEGHSETVPVLVATSTAQLEAGFPQKALATARSIEAPRYRAVALSKVALGFHTEQDAGQAEEVLTEAREASKTIRLPYARAYALGQVVLALSDMANAEDTDLFSDARIMAEEIEDDRLRAQILWELAARHERMGLGGSESLDRAAEAASFDVPSKFSRVWMLTEIAANHQSLGENERARRAFERAMEGARELTNSWARSRALARLASVLYDFSI